MHPHGSFATARWLFPESPTELAAQIRDQRRQLRASRAWTGDDDGAAVPRRFTGRPIRPPPSRLREQPAETLARLEDPLDEDDVGFPQVHAYRHQFFVEKLLEPCFAVHAGGAISRGW